jgi:hypothetical protein
MVMVKALRLLTFLFQFQMTSAKSSFLFRRQICDHLNRDIRCGAGLPSFGTIKVWERKAIPLIEVVVVVAYQYAMIK